jgi:hypothetical protein
MGSKIDQIHSKKSMKYITAFLLTVALLCFSIVTGRAAQATELPSGTYYLSLTSADSKDELKNLPVRLTTKIKTQESASSGERTFIQTDIVIESDHLGKFVGHSVEEYDKGKLIDGSIALSMTKPMAGGVTNKITTFHLIGTVSNHSARGEGASFQDVFLAKEHDSYRSETERFKWTLTNQP